MPPTRVRLLATIVLWSLMGGPKLTMPPSEVAVLPLMVVLLMVATVAGPPKVRKPPANPLGPGAEFPAIVLFTIVIGPKPSSRPPSALVPTLPLMVVFMMTVGPDRAATPAACSPHRLPSVQAVTLFPEIVLASIVRGPRAPIPAPPPAALISTV